jgi:hypothetical protein
MILESVRMVADWLSAGVAGAGSVNALLPAVPRDGGDAQPAAVTVYDATRHGWVARLAAGYEGSGITFPAVAVFVGSDVTSEGEVLTIDRDATVDICAMVIARASDSAAGTASDLYTVRAIMRSLKQFNEPAQYDTARVRNGIALQSCQSMRQLHPNVIKGGIVLAAGVVATYHVRDTAP